MANSGTGILLLVVAASAQPAVAQQLEQGRANVVAHACTAEAGSSGSFSVGTCLALTRENSTNELSTFCAWAKQQGLLAETSLANVAECIAYLEEIEDRLGNER